MTIPAVPATSQFAPSAVRTAVPFVVGLLGSWLARQGLDINDDFLASGLTAALGYAYYVVARFLEVSVNEKWGYILGWKKSPVYTDLTATVLSDEGAKVVQAPQDEPAAPVDSDAAKPGLQVKAKKR